MHHEPVLAVTRRRRAHDQLVSEFRPFPVRELGLVHDESYPVFACQLEKQIDSETMLASSFHELQVVGMIDETGVIRVFIVHPNGEEVGVRHSLYQSRGW